MGVAIVLAEAFSAACGLDADGFPGEVLAFIEALAAVADDQQVAVVGVFEGGDAAAEPVGGEGMGFVN